MSTQTPGLREQLAQREVTIYFHAESPDSEYDGQLVGAANDIKERLGQQISQILPPYARLQRIEIRPGSVTLLVVLAIYEGVSKFDDFVKSLGTIQRLIREMIRMLFRAVGIEDVNVTSSTEPPKKKRRFGSLHFSQELLIAALVTYLIATHAFLLLFLAHMLWRFKP